MKDSMKACVCAGPAFVFVILLGVYLATMAPTITWAHHGADGGDLVRAVALGSIPHPPGFPTYLVLGEVFIRLPLLPGDPAWRMNLMSAVMAAGTAALIAALVAALVGRQQPANSGPLVGVTAGLSLGLAPLFWSQALITEVYTTAAFFVALVLYLAWRETPVWALGWVWGLGLGAHPTLVCLTPIVAWAVWRAGGRNGARRQRRLFAAWTTTLTGLLGWGTMYGPVLWARRGAFSPWGDVSTLAGWWTLVSGRLYHGYLFSLPLAAWPERLWTWMGLVVRQFTPIGALVAGWGAVEMGRRFSPYLLATGLSFGAFSLYAIGYDTADSLVYLVPALPIAALWLGRGLAGIATWLGRRRAWARGLILLLPLLQALLSWGRMDVHRDDEALAWAEQTLREVPPRAAVFTDQDRYTFALWYARDVLGQRQDVVLVTGGFWSQAAYREELLRVMGGATGFPADDLHDLSPEEAAQRAGRPIIRLDDEGLWQVETWESRQGETKN